MDIERTKEFIAIIEEGSFKAAAQRLGLTPSVLSSRFGSFERALGTRLIDRSSHSLHLTDSGRLFLADARELVASYEQAASSLSDFRGHTFRSLRLMLCAQTMPAELGPFLDVYCRKYPRLFLELYDENSCLIREGLMSGELDIAFAIGRESDFTDIGGRTVLEHYPCMSVIVPDDHRLAGRSHITFSELADETFILFPEMTEPHTRNLQLSMLTQAGIPFSIYEERCSPYFFDLLVPIGRGVRLWNWNSSSVSPNSQLITITDSGYDVYMYALYEPSTQNPTVAKFLTAFLEYRSTKKEDSDDD